MNDKSPLILTRDGGVAKLCFNRPEALNAIDVPMAHAFLTAVRTISIDPAVRAVLLCGAGKAFMAGGDLSVLRSDPVAGAAALITPLHEAVVVLSKIDAPVIAQVHGVAAGAGLSLMLQADFVVAATNTNFNFAYVKIGASCDAGGSWSLPRIVGLRKALELSLLSETIDARAALRLGLINSVVEHQDLESGAMALAQRLAAGPSVALGHVRRLMRGAFSNNLRTQLEAEAKAFESCAETSDFRKGVDAFFARKSALFIGN